MNDTTPTASGLFAIFAESTDLDRPLFLHDLTFPRLIDDVVLPYDQDRPFFIDGAPVTRAKLRRIKIIRQNELFQSNFHNLHLKLEMSSPAASAQLAAHYHTFIEAIFREGGDDVTAQVLKTFDTTIKPRLKDYLPNRTELIELASRVFVEALKTLGGT